MLRKSNKTDGWGNKWVGLLTEVQVKAEDHLDKLLEEREGGDERRWRVERNLEILKGIEEEERGTRSFFAKLTPQYGREEISSLIEVVTDKKTDEKKEIERKKKHEIKRIATAFCTD